MILGVREGHVLEKNKAEGRGSHGETGAMGLKRPSGGGTSEQRPERGGSCGSRRKSIWGRKREGHMPRAQGGNVPGVATGWPRDQWGWSRVRKKGGERSQRMGIGSSQGQGGLERSLGHHSGCELTWG